MVRPTLNEITSDGLLQSRVFFFFLNYSINPLRPRLSSIISEFYKILAGGLGMESRKKLGHVWQIKLFSQYLYLDIKYFKNG